MRALSLAALLVAGTAQAETPDLNFGSQSFRFPLSRPLSRAASGLTGQQDAGVALKQGHANNHDPTRTRPQPEKTNQEGPLLPASYAKFYMANEQVLVPTFNSKNDRIALNTLAKLFDDRDVIGIDCSDLVLGLGTLHCMTQQQPR